MDEETTENGSLRLTRDQINKLAKAVNLGDGVDEVALSRGTDGRLIVKRVVKTETLRALKLY